MPNLEKLMQASKLLLFMTLSLVVKSTSLPVLEMPVILVQT